MPVQEFRWGWGVGDCVQGVLTAMWRKGYGFGSTRPLLLYSLADDILQFRCHLE